MRTVNKLIKSNLNAIQLSLVDYCRTGNKQYIRIKLFSLTEYGVFMGDYFFLGSCAGTIQQILQSDWFREQVEFSHLARHCERNPSC